jgi:hypothetical protein
VLRDNSDPSGTLKEISSSQKGYPFVCPSVHGKIANKRDGNTTSARCEIGYIDIGGPLCLAKNAAYVFNSITNSCALENSAPDCPLKDDDDYTVLGSQNSALKVCQIDVDHSFCPLNAGIEKEDADKYVSDWNPDQYKCQFKTYDLWNPTCKEGWELNKDTGWCEGS